MIHLQDTQNRQVFTNSDGVLEPVRIEDFEVADYFSEGIFPLLLLFDT